MKLPLPREPPFQAIVFAGPHRRAAGGAPPETATSAAAGHGESRLYLQASPVGIIRKFR